MGPLDLPCEYVIFAACAITCEAMPTRLVSFPRERSVHLCAQHDREATALRAAVSIAAQHQGDSEKPR